MPIRTAKENPDPRETNCYCGLWKTDPELLRRQGVPPGYCGLCQVCGEPGHTRHFPGAVPYTGSWCDRHYRRARNLHPLGAVGFFLWLAALAAAVAGLVAYRFFT